MLSSLKNIFKVPDLRNKVLFTLLIIGLYQLGANLIVPFISIKQVQALEAQAKSAGILGFLNLFSGGGLLRMALFGLGIMPYITSSIIIQLLSTVIPKLEEWRDQGAVGQKKSPRPPGTSPSAWPCCSRPASSTCSTTAAAACSAARTSTSSPTSPCGRRGSSA